MKHEDIEIGMKVYYIPSWTEGNLSLINKHIEGGIVTSKNEEFIFVCFESDNVSKACKAEQLR